MTDEAREPEVQTDRGDMEDAGAPPVVPLPVAGFVPVAGALNAAGGGLNLPTAGMAPLTGAAAVTETVGAASGAAAVGAAAHKGTVSDEDTRTADRVESALAEDGRVAMNNIAIAVSEGVVELVGTVASLRERQDAEEICAHVPGVLSVSNRLSVA